jgi:hypothetical protein
MFRLDELAIFPSRKFGGSCSISSARLYEQTSWGLGQQWKLTADQPGGSFDGIWASGCLYHLSKAEFVQCVATCKSLPSKAGVLYVSMKEGRGERYEEMLGPRYPGGAEAKALLHGRRFYAYYERGELLKSLDDFTLLTEQRVEPAEGGFELWLRKIGEAVAWPSSTFPWPSPDIYRFTPTRVTSAGANRLEASGQGTWTS